MFKNNFYPLRSIIGSSIPIKSIIPLGRPAPPFVVEIRNHPNLSEAVFDVQFDIYSKFLPDIQESGIIYRPLGGMNSMPISNSNLLPIYPPTSSFLTIFNNTPDNPFPESDPVSSIFGYETENRIQLLLNTQEVSTPAEDINHLYSGRDKTYTFLILLSEEILVGGICFSGYPYISSRIEKTPEGMTIGNFGLPREIGLTPLPSLKLNSLQELKGFQRSQFIDSEIAYTRQEIISHSGLNYLCIDPVKTNMFLLTITDLPFISKFIDLDNPFPAIDDHNPLIIQGFKGFTIPYLYFFEYKESTKKDARLASGLIGVKSNPRPLKDDGVTDDILRRAFPEYEFIFSEIDHQNDMNQDVGDVGQNQGPGYILFTAHSALGQRRNFYPSSISSLTECFVSDLLQPGGSVTLYLQQGEEYERCVAGLKAFFVLLPSDHITEGLAEALANQEGIGAIPGVLEEEERNLIEDALAKVLKLPAEINFCEKIGIKIYEIDPLDGLSPAAVDLKGKYARVLVDTVIDDFLDILFSLLLKGIPFKRISSAKYFALELTNLGSAPGQIAIHSLQMVRSAHVSVQPRPAKTQQVKAMHYRLIGADLADDFSKLGTEGFNFSIDRLVAGQTKSVLYSAMSLLDLLHTGGARIHSNVRRRAVEFEMVENFKEGAQNIRDYDIKKFVSDDFSKANFETRETDNDNTSWRNIESGKDVRWPLNKKSPMDGHRILNSKGLPIQSFEFESYSGSEIRTRTEQISSLLDPDFYNIESLKNQLEEIVHQGLNLKSSSPWGLMGFVTAQRILFKNSNNIGLWKPFENFGFPDTDLPPLPGYQTLNIPPFYWFMNEFLLNALTNTGVIKSSDLFPDAAGNASIVTRSLDHEAAMKALCRVHGLSLGFNFGGNVGVSFIGSAGLSGGVSLSVNSNVTTALRSSTTGAAGAIVLSGQELKHSLNRNLQIGYDNNISDNELIQSEQKRIVTRRELLNKDNERVKGAEVMWQNKIQDIITGSIPLNFTLPATGTKLNYRTADDSLRVRFNSGFSPSIEVDFWFELTEETIKDDN